MLPSPFASVFTKVPFTVKFVLPSELPSTSVPTVPKAPVGSTVTSLLPSPFASVRATVPFTWKF